VTEDLLDEVWISNVGDDTHGATTQGAYGDVDIENTLESLSPG